MDQARRHQQQPQHLQQTIGHETSARQRDSASFMTEVRFDTTFATKEVMRDASNPMVESQQKSREMHDTSTAHQDVRSVSECRRRNKTR